jgi:L-fuculose-phosphate aldolase
MDTFNLDVLFPILHRAVLSCLANAIEDGHDPATPAELFNSPAIHALKEEIVRTGKKLWERQYVDGNGGNISARI